MSEGMESGGIEHHDVSGFRKDSHKLTNQKDGYWTALGVAKIEDKGNWYSGVSSIVDSDTKRLGTVFFVHKTGSVHEPSKDPHRFKQIGPRGGYGEPSQIFQFKDFSFDSDGEFIAAALTDDKLKLENRTDFHATLIHNGNAEQLVNPIHVNQQPVTKETVLPKGRSKLVFYSAELGEYFTDEDINKTIHLWEIDNPDKDDPEAISKVLCDEAIQRARSQGKEISGDITAMIIDFDVPEKGVSSLTEKRSKKSQSLYHRGLPKAA